MNQESRGGRTLSSPMIAAITAGVVLVLVIAILVGVRIGQSVLASAPSSAAATTSASAPSVAPTSTPAVENEPTETPEPEPTGSSAVPTETVPPHFERATPTPVPEQSFAEVQPLPPAPPALEQADVVPAAPPSPSPEPTCPADKGVVVSLLKVEMTREGSSMDQFTATLVLENRISMPVSLGVVDSVHVIGVRETGETFEDLYVTLPDTYEVPPGRTVFTEKDLLTLHGYGSPVGIWKLDPGQIAVSNSSADMYERSLFCDYKDVTVGKPLQGSWGS